MPESDVKIQGLKEALDKISASPAEILSALKPVIQRHTAAIAAKAQSLVRVGKTGELKGSIRTEVVEGPGYCFGRITAEDDTGKILAIEYGSVTRPAHPFMRPALQQSKAAFQSEAAETVKKS